MRAARRRRYRKRKQQRRLWHRREMCQCWCGARGTYAELWSEDGIEDTCGGSGFRICYCGGDGCVCHNHSELECFGCKDCEEEDPDFDYDWHELSEWADSTN